jgi:hypothetical protein
MTIDRRRFLTLAATTAPLAALTIGIGSALAETAACYDPAALPFSQKTRRRSLGYVEASTDPAKHCSACSFFTAAAAGCGTCGLLNGPVNAGAVCSSFAPRGK